MNASIISALAALAGAITGGLTSVLASWLSVVIILIPMSVRALAVPLSPGLENGQDDARENALAIIVLANYEVAPQCSISRSQEWQDSKLPPCFPNAVRIL